MSRISNSYRVILLAASGLVFTGCTGFNSQSSVADTDTATAQKPPFSETKPLIVPADTVIYVHLKEALSAADAEAGQDFPAVLDQPLAIDNQVVAPQGTAVAGKVVAARDSGQLNRTGYVRIRLSSIMINGKEVALATNSVIAASGSIHSHSFSFLAGNSFHDTGGKQAGFTPTQRLSFRLTQPLSISTN